MTYRHAERRFPTAILVALLLVFGIGPLAAPTSARGGTLALDFTDAFPTFRGTFENFGWGFTLTIPERVDGLGFFDFGADGLGDDHQVGIWDDGGALLASTTVTGGDPIAAAVPGVGGWRFAAIAPLDLVPGAYVIGAFYPTNVDAIGINTAGIKTPSGISYDLGLATPGSVNGFAMPFLEFGPGTIGFPGFFGPNFSTVSEPSAVATLAIAITGLLCVRRRRAANG